MNADDEKRQLELELLAADLRLRRKQEFWETPRNLAILIGITAAIAAAIGFWLGRQSPAPPAPIIGPVAIGSFDLMHNGEFIDVIQTIGILVVAAMLVYVVLRLDRALTTAAKKLKAALGNQKALQEGVERLWARVELIESRQGEIRGQLDRLETKNESPPDSH